MKKVIACFSIASIVLSGTANTFANDSLHPTETHWAEPVDHAFESVAIDSKALALAAENVSKVEGLITPNQNGLLQIDSQAKQVLSPEAYQMFAKGVARINNAIQRGEMTIQHNELVSVKKDIRSQASYSFYWWGVHLTLSRKEANNFENALSRNADKWALISIVSTLIPDASVSKVAAIAAGIISFGSSTLAKDIGANKTSKGVYVDVGYTVLNTNVYPR